MYMLCKKHKKCFYFKGPSRESRIKSSTYFHVIEGFVWGQNLLESVKKLQLAK